ncbi:GNAT family N-acetyltransferase [Sphingomonas solaris]|uniref:GNAT family N-acetyltransferase n=1 Tax=Alterirhizorhabdus solaris TaxID=2529389 RepID=A0A558QTH1_9SPHN|nr:GNAT family protein [Sphingomonas solaris]TVV70424.1 GNAT family N-acetyltransferase [Sphingomonas solaris]
MPDTARPGARADRLTAPLADGVAHLEPLGESHREPLRAACAADPAIWDIYPVSYAGAGFDPAFDALTDTAGRVPFAALAGGVLVGMTGYLNIAGKHRVLEIGGTYLAPAARGSGLNRRFKQLLIDHAFACGFHRIEFRIDARNARSQAAVEKLGARREGVLRDHMITWTGHVRDTVVFAILQREWAAR